MTLQELRESRGLTRQQLADKLDVSVSLIEQYENGLQSPRGSSMLRLAKALNADVDDLTKYFNERTRTGTKTSG